MKNNKVVLFFGIMFLVLSLSLVLATTASDRNKAALALHKCQDNAIKTRNTCYSLALDDYHKCTSGTNINYYPAGMDFWMYLRNCQLTILRPENKVCTDQYKVDKTNCSASS